MTKINIGNKTLNKIKALYEQNMSVSKISKEVGISEHIIYRSLKDDGFKMRHRAALSKKYELDTSFFEKIDTEEKAYFLGWMYSDGCVFKSKKGNMFHLTLHNDDIKIIEEFRRVLKTNTPIHKIKGKNHSGLFIWSKKMCEDLISLGCGHRKSLTLQFPSYEIVPKEFMAAMIRGYFDGDGSISFKPERRRVATKIISSKDFCDGLMKFLTEEHGFDKFYIENAVSKSGAIYMTIGFGKTKLIKNFYDIVYYNATTFLNRKKEIFEKFFAWKKQKQL